uniref:Uncharacterized protein n=2 Tax=Physcomitrium patens TaxID=3218 RepID=A0A2K1K2K3_PHYPA|nr:hypothetical protein PHYPA_012484 [Physcomitrium patens]
MLRGGIDVQTTRRTLGNSTDEGQDSRVGSRNNEFSLARQSALSLNSLQSVVDTNFVSRLILLLLSAFPIQTKTFDVSCCKFNKGSGFK